MDFELTDVDRAVQEAARRFPAELVRGLGELGLLAVSVPAAEHGGSGAGPA